MRTGVDVDVKDESYLSICLNLRCPISSRNFHQGSCHSRSVLSLPHSGTSHFTHLIPYLATHSQTLIHYIKPFQW